jgi:transposase InsO family protein
MPWKKSEPMEERIEFGVRALRSENFRALCREYGITARTGYKWRERFLRYGIEGMAEESRRPRSSPGALGEREVCEMVRLKEAHRKWGPRKIRELYVRLHGEAASESSFKRVLERAGLTERRRRRRRVAQGGRLHSGRRGERPNEVWTVDFKGWWYDGAGRRCEPLTVRDEHTRYLLELRALKDSRSATVRRVFERLFERYGLPQRIRSDNGSPFAAINALLGLSRLSAWWVALGIDLERGRPGHPQDNGAHERLHRDISLELEAVTGAHRQAALDLWREQFNNERPHEALGMRTPRELYTSSARKYHGTPQALHYEAMGSRKVDASGMIKVEAERYFLSTSLAGWTVGLQTVAEGLNVWFGRVLLGQIDPSSASFLRTDIRPQKAMETNENNHQNVTKVYTMS